MNMIEDVNKMDIKEFEAAVVIAQQEQHTFVPDRPSGCGRVYVGLGYKALRKNGKAVKVLEKYGFKVFTRPNSSGVWIYVGYDNCTGVELAKGRAIAESFKRSGITAYMIADGD